MLFVQTHVLDTHLFPLGVPWSIVSKCMQEHDHALHTDSCSGHPFVSSCCTMVHRQQMPAGA